MPMHDSFTASANELIRLKRLRELFVMDSEPEPVFDAIARMASQVCGTPIALVILVDGQRQWFKANIGLTGIRETPRDVAFCAHAIEGDELLEVRDALDDPRFSDNPLVVGQTHIRFYAGAPLVLPQGERVGTLCVVDRQTRRLDAQQIEMLRGLASIAVNALTMRQSLLVKSLQVRSEYEQALSASETKYRALVDAQLELTSLATANGDLVYVNTAYARYFGCRPSDMVGRNLLDFVDPCDRADVLRMMASVLRAGRSQTGQNRMVVSGEQRWIAWTNTRHLGEDGQALLHSVGRDITQRKCVQDALQASQNFLSRTGRVARVGGWEVDLRANVVTWSEETRRLHEVDSDYQPTLQSAIAFYLPEYRAVIEGAVERATGQGTAWDLELQLMTARGQIKWVRAVGEVEFDGADAVRLVGAVQDITQHKRVQQNLAESERFLRTITDSLPIRIAYVDRDRRYRFVNLAHCARFGRERDDILGRTREELRAAPDEEAIVAFDNAAFSGQAQRFEYEEPVDGVVRRVESQLIPDLRPDGTVRGIFTTGIDVTERSEAERALQHLTTVIENTTDYVVQADANGNVKYMNPAVRAAVGLAPDDPLEERTVSEFNTLETNRRFRDVILPALASTDVWLGETTVYLADRREVPVSHMVIAHRGRTGDVERYSAVMRDISSQAQAKQLLQRQTATLQAVTEAIPAMVAVVGIDLRYRFVNSSFERWCGSQRAAIVGRGLWEVLGRVEFERDLDWVQKVLAGETVSFEKKFGGRNVVKYLAVTYIPMWLDSGSVDGFVAISQDVSQQKQEEGRLLHLSQRDALTGLLNRAGFEKFVQSKLHSDPGSPIALLYIDLDRFKPVNDTYGHPVGDQVLQQFANRLLGVVHPSDAVARLGGDEFAIVLREVGPDADPNDVAARVVASAQIPFDVAERQVCIGASVGVAIGACDAVGLAELTARADAMLYQAKGAGRGRFLSQSC